MSLTRAELIEHIYIHVPFCLKKCGYCNFYSEKFDEQLLDKYTSYLLREIELVKNKFILKPLTIYWGGGTPSLLKPDHIKKILAAVDTSQVKEITLEVNPINVNKQLAEEWQNAGINRLSLGIQSFIAKELKLLDRLHKNHHTFSAWKLLSAAGFANISLDLIYGLPYQKLEDLEFSLQEALKLSPLHISLYCLSLDQSVPLYTLRKVLPSDETIADFYEYIRTELTVSGFYQYEISNFAIPGYESSHNIAYWSDKSYIGLGPSAAGYVRLQDAAGNLRRSRYVNPVDINKYFRLIDQGTIFKAASFLSTQELQKEYIFLNLRKTEGLKLTEFQKLFGVDFLTRYKIQIAKFLKLEMIEIKSDYLRLKPQAYFVSNEIFNEFI